MSKASIVSIGNEILSGETLDTNAAYLSRKLLEINIPTISSFAISDNVKAITKTLKLACQDSDIILVTGGLGPTDDDLTRQAIAEFLGVKLALDEKLLEKISVFFAAKESQMPEKNKIQAYLPAGSKAITNNFGTAPGIIAKFKGKLIVSLPGVPAEMIQMFEESVLGELAKLADGQFIEIRRLKCFGTGESNIAEMLGDLMRRDRNPLINCTVTFGVITLHIVAGAENKAKAVQLAEKDEKMLRNKLGKLIYGTGNETLAEVVGRKLIQRKQTLAVAESCTGGLIGKLLTDVPGCSEYFKIGWITYGNEAKIEQLGVSANLIEKYGAVSKQTAEAMAAAARKKAGTNWAIAVTGIAGPDGGSREKPVGLVFIAIDFDGVKEVKQCFFSHDRDFIRRRAAQTALNMIRLQL